MGQTEGMVSFEISELIATFRESILTLMPVADRALLSWRDEDAHDDWERLVESAFHVFVQSPISLDPAHRTALPLARYDFNIPTYKHSSWIEVVSADRPSGLALVRFEAGAGDFRTMWLADPRAAGYPSPQGESREWSPDVKFRFARRDRRAGISLHDAVTPIE